MKKILFVSKNKNKAKEVSEILSFSNIQVVHQAHELEEIQSPDVKEVAKNKALLAFKTFQQPVLVEDTGLFIESMHGYPGSLIKHFIVAIGQQGIIDFLKDKNRYAKAVTSFAYCTAESDIETFTGEKMGTISEKITGESGFAWDTIFIPQGYDKTYAQMLPEEKNTLSQRKKALEKFNIWLASQNS